MAKIVSQMKRNVKMIISHIELIREAMTSRGWKQADLARASGVSTGVISRYFNEDERGISADNLFKIMLALNLVNNSIGHSYCVIQCNEEIKAICLDIKILVESGTHWGTLLKASIELLKTGLNNQKKIRELEQRLDNFQHEENSK